MPSGFLFFFFVRKANHYFGIPRAFSVFRADVQLSVESGSRSFVKGGKSRATVKPENYRIFFLRTELPSGFTPPYGQPMIDP